MAVDQNQGSLIDPGSNEQIPLFMDIYGMSTSHGFVGLGLTVTSAQPSRPHRRLRGAAATGRPEGPLSRDSPEGFLA